MPIKCITGDQRWLNGSRLVCNGYAANSFPTFFPLFLSASVFYSCSFLLHYFPIITQPESASLLAPVFCSWMGAVFVCVCVCVCVSACMILKLMCACCYSTLTCSFACVMGLLHDETNTKLSIEQPMDLKPQKKTVIDLGTRFLFCLTKTQTRVKCYLAVSCLSALRKVSGWKSSARSRVSDRRACLLARSTQLWIHTQTHTHTHTHTHVKTNVQRERETHTRRLMNQKPSK